MPITAALPIVTIFLGGVVQGLLGFGFRLITLPILLIVLAPKVAVPVLVLLSPIMALLLLTQCWRAVQPKAILRLGAGAFLGIPLGIGLLLILSASTIRILVGIFILAVAILLFTGHTKKFSRKAEIPTGFVSGVLNGSVGLSGPPIALLYVNQEMPKKEFRADILFYFFIVGSITALLFAFAGLITKEVLSYAFRLTPMLVLGILIGNWQQARFSDKRFRSIALVVISIAGASAILTSF